MRTMRSILSDHHERRPLPPARAARSSPGLAFLMATSGCWMGGVHFVPLFLGAPEGAGSRETDDR
jgi:hypothetical protein